MKHIIHIFGASGSGTTTSGRRALMQADIAAAEKGVVISGSLTGVSHN